MSEITSSKHQLINNKAVLSNGSLGSILVSKWKTSVANTVPTFLFIGMALNMPRPFRILGKFQNLPNFHRQYNSLSISSFLWMYVLLIPIEIRALGKENVASRLFSVVIIIIIILCLPGSCVSSPAGIKVVTYRKQK